MVLITLKYNKTLFSEVVLDPSQSLSSFKNEIFSLTKVPPDRQKLMCKGVWIGILKDTIDLKTLNLRDGIQITLIGAADTVTAPTNKIQFVEDLNEEEKALKGTVGPSGLVNLGNTCYMNSTIECFRHMPEIREVTFIYHSILLSFFFFFFSFLI